MSSQQIIVTGYFRIGAFPHLDAPYASKPNDTPKYSLVALFPQDGITKPTGRPDSNCANILEALNKVCMDEFKVDYNTLMSNHTGYGIQYPPKFIDGNYDFMKDENKNPTNNVRPESVGMWKISFKSADPVDLVAPSGNENISADRVCAGYWARAEISVDAYTNKSNQRVLAIKLVNVQLAYEDEKLASGGFQKNAGTSTFGNMAINDTNVAPSINSGVAMPGQPTPGMMPGQPTPGMMPGQPTPGTMPGQPTPGMMPGQPTPGTMPGQPTPGTMPGQPTPGMMPGQPTPGTMPGQPTPGTMPGQPTPGTMPGQPTPGMMPGQPTPGTMPGPGSIPGQQIAPGAANPNYGGMPAPGVTPGANANAHSSAQGAPAQPAPNTNCRVIMNQGEHTYDQYMNAGQGWTDELLVSHGKATWNYNYVG